jgi:hypothetical protein
MIQPLDLPPESGAGAGIGTCADLKTEPMGLLPETACLHSTPASHDPIAGDR